MKRALVMFARALRRRCPSCGAGPAPIVFYPYSKLFWLAFDLLFRPLRPEDFEPPRST
jgi:hypothetical protein